MNDAQTKLLYQLLGKRLRDARKGVGLSQENVADDLGIKRASVANFESGRQRLPVHTIYGFAQVVRLPIARLFPSVAELEVDDVPAGLKIVTVEGRQYAVRLDQAVLVNALTEASDDIQKTGSG